MDSPDPNPPNTILCLYCRATIYFPGLPANRYQNHLFAEHNIMYEVSNVINRTLQLQMPKDYPELVGASHLPDSSNRVPSPSMSMCSASGASGEMCSVSGASGPSPRPSPAPTHNFGLAVDSSTQTEPTNVTSFSCQVDLSSDGDIILNMEEDEEEINDEEELNYEEEITEPEIMDINPFDRRGCPKGGWPSQQGKKRKRKKGKFKIGPKAKVRTKTAQFMKLQANIQKNIRKILERSIQKKTATFECELCDANFKKLYKLKLHLMRAHETHFLETNEELTKEHLQLKKNEFQQFQEDEPIEYEEDTKPERKSTRIQQATEEKKDDNVSRQNMVMESGLVSKETCSQENDENWMEGCEFFCMLCSNSFTAYGAYKHHIGDTHGMLFEDYHAKFGKHGEIVNRYTCIICNADIIHRFENIKIHLKNVHGMTIEEYNSVHRIQTKVEDNIEGEYNDRLVAVSLPDTAEAAVEDDIGNEVMDTVPVEQELKEDERMDTDRLAIEPCMESDNFKRKWFEGCTYICCACNKSYDIYFSYHGHVKKIHNMTMEQYHSKYGTEGEISRYYSCKICQTNVVWRHFNIKKHIESQHGMAMEKYAEQYEPDTPPKHIKIIIKEPRRSEEERISYEKTTQMKEVVSIKEEKPVLKGWYEGCLFSCQLDGCKKIYNIYEAYTTHIIGIHKITMDQYHQRFGTKGEVVQQYQCLICSAKIAHKYNNIASHLTLIHDLSIQQYEERFICMKPKTSEVKVRGSRDSKEIKFNETFKEPEPEKPMAVQTYIADQYDFTEEDSTLEEPIDDDERSETALESEHAWYHGSNLTCQICKKNFANDQWYFHHFSKIHGITKEKYNAQYGKAGEIWHQYQCLICNNEIRWKYSSIRQHLRQCHAMTIQEYEAQYMDVEPEELIIQPMEALKEKAMNPCRDVGAEPENRSLMKPMMGLPPPPPLKLSPAAFAAGRSVIASPPPINSQMPKGGNITFNTRPSSQWYHGSDLTCLICRKQFVDFTYYCTHIRTTHQTSKESYNETYGTSAEAFRLYRCLVCGISIKWTYQSICGHLKSHEITIKDYEVKYNVLEQQSTESGKIADLAMNNTNIDGIGHVSKKQKYDHASPIARSAPSTSSPLIVHQAEKISRISADISSPTGKWYNQCKFTCKACPEEKYFTVPQALRMHLNGIHSLTRKQYEGEYGTAETITKYWTCLVCSKELKCQKGIIIQHLLNVHSTELVDYERQYMAAGDQVVARESKKPRKLKVPKPALAENFSDQDSADLSRFLVQRMDEGLDNISMDGPPITQEVSAESSVDPSACTSISTLEVEGMETVPWFFGCRYSCAICNKVWHYPQAARYHMDSVHKLNRAQYEAQYGSCEVETRLFHCSLCSRTMKCERDIIKYHLEAKHSMSLENYIDQFPNPIVTVGESRRSNAAPKAMESASNDGSLDGISNVMLENPPMVQIFTQFEDTPTKSPVIGQKKAPWYRGSTFSCTPCNRKFTAQVSYISHINTKHGMNLREYREQYGTNEEIRQYGCQVPDCNKVMSWTYSGINDHLKSHSLTMIQYERQFLTTEAPEPILSPACNESALEEPGLEPEDFSNVAENWSNGYLHQCKSCGKQVIGSTITFGIHLREEHNTTLEDYTRVHGNSGNRIQNHACHLCNKIIPHNLDSIKEHIEQHSISLEHYYHKFIGSTNIDATNAHIIVPGEPTKPYIATGSPKAFNLATPSRPSMGILTAVASSSTSPSKPTSIKVRKNHWANGCQYQCSLCKGQKYPEEFMFKKHILMEHSMSTEEYQNNYGDPAIVKQLHICRVCNKDVKHEYTAILNHLRVKHSMTLTEYTRTYIKTSQEPSSLETPSQTPETSDPGLTLTIVKEEAEDQFYVLSQPVD